MPFKIPATQYAIPRDAKHLSPARHETSRYAFIRWATSNTPVRCRGPFVPPFSPATTDVLHAAKVLFPLAPGIESIYEPAMEEVEEALDTAKENVDQLQSEAREAMKAMDDSIEKAEDKLERWMKSRRK